MSGLNKPTTPIDITADTNYLQLIVKRITVSGRLPYTVPIDHIPIIIADAAKYFYEEYPEATKMNRYIIKYDELQNSVDSENGVPYAVLPSHVIAVTNLQQIGGNLPSLGVARRRSPNLMLLDPMRFAGFLNGQMSYEGVQPTSTQGRYLYSHDIGDHMLTLYTSSMIDSMYKKEITYDYSDLTNELQIIGSYTGNLVIEVYEGVELSKLYTNKLFTDYVVGKCLMDLGMVIGTFDLTLQGNVSVNYEQYYNIGEKMVERVEEKMNTGFAGDIYLSTS